MNNDTLGSLNKTFDLQLLALDQNVLMTSVYVNPNIRPCNVKAKPNDVEQIPPSR